MTEDRPPRHGEVAPGAIGLDPAVVPVRGSTPHYDVHPGSARADFRVPFQGGDQLTGPRLKRGTFRVATIIEIHPRVGVAGGEHEAHSIVPAGEEHARRGVEVAPGRGVGTRGPGAPAVRHVRDLGRLAAALLVPPNDVPAQCQHVRREVLANFSGQRLRARRAPVV